VAVRGLLSEGYNLQSTSNYGQPLMDFTSGQKLQSIGAIAQILTNMTSQTLSNSIQVYENETPVMMTLPLSFMSLRDPVKEVSLPERYILEMKAPSLAKGALLEARSDTSITAITKTAGEFLNPLAFWNRLKNSNRPSIASVFISRHIMFPECLITDVEVQDESVNHKIGHALQKTISVTIAFQRAYNSSEFAALLPY
ncbi:MAG: hypothetical protein KAU21_09460, partial [Gammaproteobacteria bacterium]|nr:hypothetical protein [Gammaproteobacteria bacterium]